MRRKWVFARYEKADVVLVIPREVVEEIYFVTATMLAVSKLECDGKHHKVF